MISKSSYAPLSSTKSDVQLSAEIQKIIKEKGLECKIFKFWIINLIDDYQKKLKINSNHDNQENWNGN